MQGGFGSDLPDVFGRCATASTDNIDESLLQELPNVLAHLLGALIVFPESIGQSGIGVGR
jgi:hypothetical protein